MNEIKVQNMKLITTLHFLILQKNLNSQDKRVRSKRRENPTKVLALSLSTREKHWNNFDDFHIIFIAFDLIKNEWILHITSNLILTSIYMCICIPGILCFVFIFIYSCHLHRLLQLDSIRIFEDEPLQW